MAVRVYVAASFVVDEEFQGLMILQSLKDYITTRYPENDPKIVPIGSLELEKCNPVSKALTINVA